MYTYAYIHIFMYNYIKNAFTIYSHVYVGPVQSRNIQTQPVKNGLIFIKDA